MYNMALDSTLQTNKEMKMKIKRNIGLTYVKLGMFGRSIEVLEDIMNEAPDFDVAFNLILCIFALGDQMKMKTWFERMLMIDLPGTEDEETKEILELQNTNDNDDY
jgi:tetratricopeptide (TPR) repeat protein